MLTSSQKRVLDYIVAQIDATDMTPTYRAMAAALGRASAGSVHATVDQLVLRGFLERRGTELRVVRRVVSQPVIERTRRPRRGRRIGWEISVIPGTAHAVTGLPPVVYFKFDDDSKQLVPWRSEVRKVS